LNQFFQHDGLNFRYLDVGDGVPFVFQHGLGGDVNQPAGLFRPPTGIRLIAFDCRAHGETRPLGDPGKLNFNSFADDLLALLDHLNVERAVIGGISMGAGVALNFTLRYPARAIGLVLSRPAWLDQPLPEQLRVYLQIAALIRQGARTMPGAEESLLKQFASPRAVETVERLERIPRDAPNRDRREWATIRVPTLVLGNRQDVIHPYAYAETLAREIPGATFRELTPKSVNEQQHAADTQKFLNEFFHERIMTC
jgi:pimeloyl-ACP methyl ester carboxylesterase